MVETAVRQDMVWIHLNHNGGIEYLKIAFHAGNPDAVGMVGCRETIPVDIVYGQSGLHAVGVVPDPLCPGVVCRGKGSVPCFGIGGVISAQDDGCPRFHIVGGQGCSRLGRQGDKACCGRRPHGIRHGACLKGGGIKTACIRGARLGRCRLSLHRYAGGQGKAEKDGKEGFHPITRFLKSSVCPSENGWEPSRCDRSHPFYTGMIKNKILRW
ncbi:MAG TPA: hypothetical protein H9733_08255 [Candidatus Anaerotignum merdipullorum]|nr:hypothetical protein [Candidatus Anaerotignum merdipullorum]